MSANMPTARDFEDAAVDYCLNNNGVGVWVMHVEPVNHQTYDVTIRMGGRYRMETKGVAVIRVIYYPQQRHFICQPAESVLPDAIPVEDEVYLFG